MQEYMYVVKNQSLKVVPTLLVTKPTDQTYERRAGDAWLFNMLTKSSSISSKLGEYKYSLSSTIIQQP